MKALAVKALSAGDARPSMRLALAPATDGLRRDAAANEAAADQTLMARLAAGDRQAMRAIYARHQLGIYRFALRLVGNPASAEDIVSEVFIELWRHAASFQGRARLSTFILSIARNKAISLLRNRVDQPLDEATAAAIPDDTATAEERLDASQRGAALRKCLGELSTAHREIIDLVYYHERPVEEVAAILGIPAATVKTRMFYARKRLAESLRAAGIAAL